MGLFGGFGRLISGKPIFQPGDTVQPGQVGQQLSQPIVPPLVDPQGPTFPDPSQPGFDQQQPQPGADQQQLQPQQEVQITPVARITRVECPVNGSRMDVYGDIRNESGVPVYIDKVIMLGVHKELDREIPPGQTHQFLLYQGSPFTDGTVNGYADIQYRSDAGHYYLARHQIRTHNLQNSNLFQVSEFVLTSPIHHLGSMGMA